MSGTNRREVLFVLNRASPSAAASDTSVIGGAICALRSFTFGFIDIDHALQDREYLWGTLEEWSNASICTPTIALRARRLRICQ